MKKDIEDTEWKVKRINSEWTRSSYQYFQELLDEIEAEIEAEDKLKEVEK